MGQRLLVSTTTAAIEDPEDADFVIKSNVHKECAPIIAVSGLAGDEEACLWFYSGFDWLPVEANSNDGVQVNFTKDYCADIFNGAGRFAITKTSTASPVYVTIQDGRL